MTIKPEVLDALLAAGASAEMIVAAVKADMRQAEELREAKRAGNAERQQRWRDKRTSRKSNARNALRDVTPPIDRTHTPSDISPDGENQNSRGEPNPFPRPVWADEQVWADWLDTRKQKKARNTATAYSGFLADIAKLANDQWPPGRLLEYAVRRSWAGIFEPKEGYPTSEQHPRNVSVLPAANSRGTRPDRCLDMLRAARSAQDSTGDLGDDFGTWSSLPAIGSG